MKEEHEHRKKRRLRLEIRRKIEKEALKSLQKLYPSQQSFNKAMQEGFDRYFKNLKENEKEDG